MAKVNALCVDLNQTDAYLNDRIAKLKSNNLINNLITNNVCTKVVIYFSMDIQSEKEKYEGYIQQGHTQY